VTRVCRVYEQDVVRDATGVAIRPGGLALTERALSFCPPAPGACVLDAGCGAAATVEYLTDAWRVRAVGIDPSRHLLRAGRQRRPDLPLTQAVGERLPFPGGAFDILLAECCLSLMGDGDRALGEFARVLRPGGTLIVSDIYARNPAGIPAGVPADRPTLACCLSNALSREWLEARLPRHGLAMALWEDHTAALKHLAGQIIFEHGSLDAFWGTVLGGGADGGAVAGSIACRSIARLKPGYFLMLARKTA
jgi:arsenite methyltransferase